MVVLLGRRSVRRTYGIAAAVVAVVTMASACSSSGGGSDNAAANPTGGADGGCSAPSTVTLAAFPPGATLSTDMASALGYFKDVEQACNTTIKIASYDAPANMLAGLVSGQIQFAVPSAPNIINAALQHQTLVDVATLSQGGSGVWITKAGTQLPGQGLDAVKILKGDETWAITSLKGVSELYVRAIYDAIHVDSSKLKLLALGSSGIPPAISGGKADDAHLPAIPAAQLIANGDAQELLNPSGPAAYDLVGFVPSWVLTSTPSVTQKYPELAARMAAAELKGVKYLQDNFTNPDAVYSKMPDSFTSTTSKDVFSKAWAWNVSAFVTTGLAQKSDLVHLGEIMAKYGLITNFDDSVITDQNVVPDIQKRAFELLGEPVPTSNVDDQLLKSAAN
jgi:hypothetical protein